MNKTILTLAILVFGFTSNIAQNSGYRDALKKVGDVYISYEILFGTGNDSIRSESLEFLDNMAVFLQQNTNLVLEVSNHCDERFQNTFSSTCLTCKRAIAVAEYLVSKGINHHRIFAHGYNASKPLIKEAKTEEEHQKNRRTEFKILRTDFKE